jgi:conjugal transfer pilus assembly protein TraB
MTQNTRFGLPDVGDVRQRQLTIVAVVIVVLAAAAALLYLSARTQQQQRVTAQKTQLEKQFQLPGKPVDAVNQWIAESETQLKAVTDANRKLLAHNERLSKQITQLREDFERYEKRKANSPPEQPVSESAALPDNVRRAPPLPPPIPDRTDPNATPATTSDELKQRIETTMVPESEVVEVRFQRAEKKAQPHIRNRIPAGFFGKAVLLSGLDAPTGALGQQNPHPVLLQFLSHGSLPNEYQHRVRFCRVIASGYGVISDERAHLRLEQFSCVLRDGAIISAQVKGFVAGEDGKNGLRGRLVSKQGSLIAKAFLSGVLSGVGNAVSQRSSTVTTTPEGSVRTFDPDRIGEQGLTSGVGRAGDRLADWYIDRANEIYPIIEIDAGRKVDLIFTEDLLLEDNLITSHTPS